MQEKTNKQQNHHNKTLKPQTNNNKKTQTTNQVKWRRRPVLRSYCLETTSMKTHKEKADGNTQSCLLQEGGCQVKRSKVCKWAHPPEMLKLIFRLLVSSDFILLFFFFFFLMVSLYNIAIVKVNIHLCRSLIRITALNIQS